MGESSMNQDCEKMVKVDRLKAELYRRMCTTEAMDLYKTSYELKASLFEAMAEAHEAKHAHEDGKISHAEFTAKQRAKDEAIDRFEIHDEAVNAYFADLDEQIQALEEELDSSFADGLLSIALDLHGGDSRSSLSDLLFNLGASAVDDFERSSAHEPVL